MCRQRYPVGIDLGTTFSAISYVDERQQVRTVRLEDGASELASAIYFRSPSEILVGNGALDYALVDASKVARAFKPEMGNRDWTFAVWDNVFRAEELSAMILKKLLAQATAKIGAIEHVVISVPYMFDEVKRRATRRAGEIAGVQVLDIVDEPVAAALAYGHTIRQGRGGGFWGEETLDQLFSDEVILVYDLGGGTFDLTLMQLGADNSFRVLATDGDPCLGGENWDQELMTYLTEEYTRIFGLAPSDNPELMQELLTSARHTKIALSERPRVPVSLRNGERSYSIEIRRGEFEDLTRHLVERTRITLESMLQRKDMRYGHVSFILLVGGSSRMPMIRNMLVREVRRELDASLPPDTAVSQGAALYAAYRLGDRSMRGIKVKTVNPHALGLLVHSRKRKTHLNDVLILANEPTEKEVTKSYPVAHGAKHVPLVVLQGELPEPEDCVRLGEVHLPELPREMLQDARVRVTFSFQQNGLLRLRGVLRPSNGDQPVEVNLDLKVEESMTPEEVTASVATLAGIEIK
jgi:molecular chaperone DnaK